MLVSKMQKKHLYIIYLYVKTNNKQTQQHEWKRIFSSRTYIYLYMTTMEIWLDKIYPRTVWSYNKYPQRYWLYHLCYCKYRNSGTLQQLWHSLGKQSENKTYSLWLESDKKTMYYLWQEAKTHINIATGNNSASGYNSKTNSCKNPLNVNRSRLWNQYWQLRIYGLPKKTYYVYTNC